MSQLASPEEAQRFVEKWSASDLSERAASHEHFIDLCRLLGQPAPAEADPTGKDYCLEKAVKVTQAASRGSKGEGGYRAMFRLPNSKKTRRCFRSPVFGLC